MGAHFDTYAAFVVLESDLNTKRAEREALVSAAIAARKATAADRPAATGNLSPRRFLDALRPIRGMIRLARS